MIQSTMSSSFSSGIHLQREKGFVSSLQMQRRHNQKLNADKENNIRGFSCHKILDSTTERFSSSCIKPIVIKTLKATSNGEFVLQPKDDHKETLQSNISKYWTSIYRFSRPYTLIGIITAVSSISLLPLTSVGDLSPALFVGYLKALIPFVFAKIYVAGINQVVDVDVDMINKPHLPLASGELSMWQGKAIVSTCGFMCLATGILFQSIPLFIGVLVYFLFGTVYSIELPLLRWKTNPFLAVLCMVGGHGPTIQPAVFFHIQHVLGRPLAFTKTLGFATIFISLFFVVIALFKDIPDVEGDQAFGNRTFSVRHGKKKVFCICVGILLSAYGSAIVIGASSSYFICKIVSVIGHCTLASLLLLRAKSLNLDDNASSQSFYMFLWKLFYAEYVLIHFMR